MTTAERKEIAYLHRDLCNVLTNCDTDKQFYKRLLWAQKDAEYETAWEVVYNALIQTKSPLSVAEIFKEIENDLPEGFSKGKVQYGLTHQWEDKIVKIEGKPNTYRLK